MNSAEMLMYWEETGCFQVWAEQYLVCYNFPWQNRVKYLRVCFPVLRPGPEGPGYSELAPRG